MNSVKDIIEEGNKIIYKCSGDFTSLSMELAENQSEEEPMPSDDEADQEADN